MRNSRHSWPSMTPVVLPVRERTTLGTVFFLPLFRELILTPRILPLIYPARLPTPHRMTARLSVYCKNSTGSTWRNSPEMRIWPLASRVMNLLAKCRPPFRMWWIFPMNPFQFRKNTVRIPEPTWRRSMPKIVSWREDCSKKACGSFNFLMEVILRVVMELPTGIPTAILTRLTRCRLRLWISPPPL